MAFKINSVSWPTYLRGESNCTAEQEHCQKFTTAIEAIVKTGASTETTFHGPGGIGTFSQCYKNVRGNLLIEGLEVRDDTDKTKILVSKFKFNHETRTATFK